MKARTFVMSLILAVFALASIASAQPVTSFNNGDYNVAQATLQNRGLTIDRIEFTVPNEVVTQPDGIFQPDASIVMSIPVTNSRSRAMVCEVGYHHTDSTEAQRARRIGSVTGLSSGVTIAGGASSTLQYTIDLNSESAWQADDWNAVANFETKVVCRGIMPTDTPVTSHD